MLWSASSLTNLHTWESTEQTQRGKTSQRFWRRKGLFESQTLNMQTVKHLLVCISLKAAAQFVSSCSRRVRPTEQTQRLTVLTAFSPFFPLRRWTALWLWSWSMRSTGRSGSLWSFTTLPPRSSHLQHSRSLLPHLLPRRRLLLLLCLHRWRREAEQWWWKVSRFTDYHQCIYVWKCTDTKTVLSDISNVWSLTWDLTWRRNRRSAAERRPQKKSWWMFPLRQLAL